MITTRAIADVFRANDDPHMYGAWLSCAADYEIAVGELSSARSDVETSLHEALVADCASCESQALVSQALLNDEPADRLATTRRALQLAHEIGEPWGALCAMKVVVAALADVGAVEDAAIVAGATRAARIGSGLVSLLPARAAALRNGEAVARDVLGIDASEELAKDGAGLDYASAVAHALA